MREVERRHGPLGARDHDLPARRRAGDRRPPSRRGGRRGRRGARRGRRSVTRRYLFSEDGTTIDEQVAGLLRGRRVGLAESCSGGLLAARLTAAPGRLGVRRRQRGRLLEPGEVGPARRRPRADRAPRRRLARGRRGDGRRGAGAVPTPTPRVSITGIAGPEGGTKEKPVGYVCFCAKLAERSEPRARPRDPGRPPGHPRALGAGRAPHAADPARRRGGAALVPAALEPFEVRVAEQVLDDLRARLGRTRWPEQPAEQGWELGVDVAYLRELCGSLGGPLRLARVRVTAERLSEPPLERPPPDLGAKRGRRAAGDADPRLAGRADRVPGPDPAAGGGGPRRGRAVAAGLRVVGRPGPAAERGRGLGAAARADGGRPGVRALRGPGRRLGRQHLGADGVRLAGHRGGGARQRRLGAPRPR